MSVMPASSAAVPKDMCSVRNIGDPLIISDVYVVGAKHVKRSEMAVSARAMAVVCSEPATLSEWVIAGHG